MKQYLYKKKFSDCLFLNALSYKVTVYMKLSVTSFRLETESEEDDKVTLAPIFST